MLVAPASQALATRGVCTWVAGEGHAQSLWQLTLTRDKFGVVSLRAVVATPLTAASRIRERASRPCVAAVFAVGCLANPRAGSRLCDKRVFLGTGRSVLEAKNSPRFSPAYAARGILRCRFNKLQSTRAERVSAHSTAVLPEKFWPRFGRNWGQGSGAREGMKPRSEPTECCCGPSGPK